MDGIIILDKDSGIFSRSAGWRVAKMFGTRKFGHIGTLDPMATGVLPIAIGNGTKIIPFIEDVCSSSKEYLFGLRFGINTDTLDITGNVQETNDFVPDLDAIKAVCSDLIGDIFQIPPMFSAIHIDGKRAYELARNGEKNIEIKPRLVNIEALEYLGNNGDIYDFKVVCSRGTYVRSIVRDIAQKCGTIATTTYIRRTLSHGFSIKNAVKLDFLEKMFNNGDDISKYLISPDYALGDIPVINLDDKDAELYKNGGFVKSDEANGLRRVRCNGKLIGIGCVADGLLRPKRTL